MKTLPKAAKTLPGTAFVSYLSRTVMAEDRLFTDVVKRWIMGPMAPVIAEVVVKLLLRTPLARVPRELRPSAQALREARRRRPARRRAA